MRGQIWGWDNFIKEADTGEGIKFSKSLYWYCKFVLPVIILIIFALGIKSVFFK